MANGNAVIPRTETANEPGACSWVIHWGVCGGPKGRVSVA
jgi:hypothetical protein